MAKKKDFFSPKLIKKFPKLPGYVEVINSFAEIQHFDAVTANMQLMFNYMNEVVGGTVGCSKRKKTRPKSKVISLATYRD